MLADLHTSPLCRNAATLNTTTSIQYSASRLTAGWELSWPARTASCETTSLHISCSACRFRMLSPPELAIRDYRPPALLEAACQGG